MNYSIKVVLRLDKITETTKEAPVCIRVIKDRQITYKTIFKIKPEYWDLKNCNVKKSYSNAKEMNAVISQKRSEIENEVLQISKSNDEFGVSSIRNKIKNKSTLDFFQYADNYIQGLSEKGNISLYRRYKTILAKFKFFVKTETLAVKSINLKLIKDYETFLAVKYNNKTNTIASNIKILSKFVSDIYKEYNLDRGTNPFRDYKFRYEVSQRAYLEQDELKKIINLKLTPLNTLYDTQQAFIFECYTGLRVSDILTLKWKNYFGDSISLVMRKTNKHIEIPLTDKIKEMIDRKRHFLTVHNEVINPNKYIFNILKQDIEIMTPEDELNSIKTATTMLNKRLKRISKLVQIQKNISTHTGRHTFATLLITKGADVYNVMELLGHSNVTITQIYAKVVNEKKREAINLLND
jgi:integrase